jgi:hypothetical protein
MPPHLNCQNNGSRKQKGANGNMRYGSGDHGKLGLGRIFAPCDPRQEGGEA